MIDREESRPPGGIGRATNLDIFTILNGVILFLIGVATVYPLLYEISISLSPITEVMRGGLILFPRKLTTEAYRFAFRQSGIPNAYAVTVYITLVGTAVNLAMTSLGAYVLSKRQLPGRKMMTTFVVISLVFNGGLIPFYIVVKSLGLINKLWSLIIPGAINTFYLLIMRNFYEAIPETITDSALIDGASEYRMLRAIVFPLSKPVLATLGLYYAVAHWNEYFHAILFLNRPRLMPLQVIIRSMYQGGTELMLGSDYMPPPVETIKSATLVIAILPVMCIYPFLQKYFVRGIMIGAVKG